MLILLIDLIFKCLYCQNYFHSLRLWLQGRLTMSNNNNNSVTSKIKQTSVNVAQTQVTQSSQQITMRETEIDYKEDFTDFDARINNNSNTNNNNSDTSNVVISIDSSDSINGNGNFVSPVTEEQQSSLQVSHCQRWFLFITSMCI